MTKAKRYNERKPKNIELYSRNPPSMAPIKLDDSAVAIEFVRLISVEKIIPEKNSGRVSSKGMMILLIQGEELERLVNVMA
jgi:hypothetical protein